MVLRTSGTTGPSATLGNQVLQVSNLLTFIYSFTNWSKYLMHRLETAKTGNECIRDNSQCQCQGEETEGMESILEWMEKEGERTGWVHVGKDG